MKNTNIITNTIKNTNIIMNTNTNVHMKKTEFMTSAAITSRYILDGDYQIQIQIQTQEKAQIQTQMQTRQQ